MKPEVVSLEKKRNEVSLNEKVEKYFYWLTTYGHEAASMWVQGNLSESEIPEFKEMLKKEFRRYGL